MIPKHSKKCIHLWNTATNQLESRKFLFILEVCWCLCWNALAFFWTAEVLEFLDVDFLWCLRWWHKVANDYNILEYLSIFDFFQGVDTCWNISKHVEATVGASWCADGHRWPIIKLARGTCRIPQFPPDNKWHSCWIRHRQGEDSGLSGSELPRNM